VERPFWMISMTHLFVEVFFLIQVALIPVFIREFQLSLLEVSMVVMVPTFIALLTNVPSGFLADRLNARHLLSVGMIIMGISAIVLSQTGGFWMLVLAASAMRLSSPIYHIVGLSQISKLLSQGRMSRSIGIHNALGGLGSAIGLMSLTVFLSTVGWRWTYLFWAVPIIAWGLLILRSSSFEMRAYDRKEVRKRGIQARLSLVLSGVFAVFLVSIALREAGGAVTQTYMTTYLVEIMGLPEATASLIFGLGPFMGMVGSLSGGYLGERVNAKRGLSLSILGSTICLAIIAWSSQLWLLAAAFVVYSFFSHGVWVPMSTMVAEISPSTERGLSYSVFFFSEGLIASVAPTAAAAVIGISDIWYMLPFSMTFFVAGLIMLQLLPYPRIITGEKTRGNKNS